MQGLSSHIGSHELSFGGGVADRLRVLDGAVQVEGRVLLLRRKERPEAAHHGGRSEGPSCLVDLGGDVVSPGRQDDLHVVPRPRVQDGPLVDLVVVVLEHVFGERVTLGIYPVFADDPAWGGSNGLGPEK